MTIKEAPIMDILGKNQEPIFFGEQERQLYGVLHYSSGSELSQVKRGIVVCSSFADEFMKTFGQIVLWARTLSSHGYFVLRFHGFGTGDSGGDYSKTTFNGMVSDIKDAIYFLKKNYYVEEIGLFGFRLGATLAAKTAETRNVDSLSNPKFSFLIIWAPIVNTKKLYRIIRKVEDCQGIALPEEKRSQIYKNRHV